MRSLLSGCLERLAPHLRLDYVAITGGIGIDMGLAVLGQPTTRDRVADLDLVARSIDVISPSVVSRFLVSHRHVVRPGVPKFMVQLVDPASRVRIDIFPDVVGSIADAWTIRVGTQQIKVLPLERIFEHKVQTLLRASHAAPIDPKHVRDAQALGVVLRRPVPTVAPEVLAPDVYGIEDDRYCDRCEVSRDPNWPLAPKDQIFEWLGWTRQPNIGSKPPARSRAAAAEGAR